MKRTLRILVILRPIFCSTAEQPCGVTTDCSPKTIKHCPDTGCAHPDKNGKPHHFDPKLDKLKNIKSDERKSDMKNFEWIKGRPIPSPTDYSKCGDRAALEQIGEGKKITVMAWALHGETQGPESCNCDLPGAENHDTHIVLVDPQVKNPTLASDQSSSVTAEFTPRVRLKHPNFTTKELSSKMRHKGKLSVRVTGLLMFDSKHFFDKPKPTTRATYWEIHPVFKMDYCPDGGTCRANSDENWKNLDNG